ncbi:MAG: hypothetical protein N2652_03315 [Kiritimatiellae bacterium]|nr:hypothetical protein [Kiritimatiellia bacterium]
MSGSFPACSMVPVYFRAALVSVWVASAGCERGGEGPSARALESAWTFASAITNDAADRAKYRERVVRGWMELGELRRAEALARQVGDWRSVVLLADLAAEHARRGQAREAARLLAEAEEQVANVRGWPLDRVRAHLARARAYAGDVGPAKVLRERYDHDPDIRGRLHGSAVIALVAAGRWEEAVAVAKERPQNARVEDAVELTAALRDAAALPVEAPERRRQLLELAWGTAGEIPGWKSVEARLDILEAMVAVGVPAAEIAERLAPISDGWLGMTAGGEVRLIVLGRIAELWGRVGEAARVRRIAEVVGAEIGRELQPIDQPALWARLASAAALAGDEPLAVELFDRAIRGTVELANLRPRAMAAVETALAVVRGRMDPAKIGESWARLRTSIHGG